VIEPRSPVSRSRLSRVGGADGGPAANISISVLTLAGIGEFFVCDLPLSLRSTRIYAEPILTATKLPVAKLILIPSHQLLGDEIEKSLGAARAISADRYVDRR